MSTARERLKAWLAEHDDPCIQYSLTDIGKAIGVSREMVRQLMPAYARGRVVNRRANVQQRILSYLDAHSDALRPQIMGGIKLSDLAVVLGVDKHYLLGVWKKMGLPLTRGMLKGSRNELKRIVVRRVIGEEVCEVCGRTFPWNVQKEWNTRKGLKKYLVCSTRCGCAMRGLERTLEAAPRHQLPSEARRGSVLGVKAREA